MIDWADARAGEQLERGIRSHHHRPFARVGRAAQLDPPDDRALWSAGDPPARSGCELEVLIDGRDALSAIAGALQGARSHVHISGGDLLPDFEVTRGDG